MSMRAASREAPHDAARGGTDSLHERTAMLPGNHAFFCFAALSASALLGCAKNKADEGAAAAPANGSVVSLRADNGKWMGRCRKCQNAVQAGDRPNDDTATVHLDGNDAPFARFTVVSLPGGKIALRSDNGSFLARCNACIAGATYPDSLTIHVADAQQAQAQFSVLRLKNGKYALRADNDKFVARCRNCSPGATKQDTVTAHAVDPEAEAGAQWDLAVVPG